MIVKTHIPRIGSKFVPDEFRPNSGYISFYNHINTVFLTQRGGKSDNTLGYIVRRFPRGTYATRGTMFMESLFNLEIFIQNESKALSTRCYFMIRGEIAFTPVWLDNSSHIATITPIPFYLENQSLNVTYRRGARYWGLFGQSSPCRTKGAHYRCLVKQSSPRIT